MTVEPQKATIPTMYKKIVQDEDVPRGYVKIIQLLTYAIEGKRKNEFGEMVDNKVSKGIFFCQLEEDKDYFVSKNSNLIIESFNVQLKIDTAKEYLDNPENIKAFQRSK